MLAAADHAAFPIPPPAGPCWRKRRYRYERISRDQVRRHPSGQRFDLFGIPREVPPHPRDPFAQGRELFVPLIDIAIHLQKVRCDLRVLVGRAAEFPHRACPLASPFRQRCLGLTLSHQRVRQSFFGNLASGCQSGPGATRLLRLGQTPVRGRKQTEQRRLARHSQHRRKPTDPVPVALIECRLGRHGGQMSPPRVDHPVSRREETVQIADAGLIPQRQYPTNLSPVAFDGVAGLPGMLVPPLARWPGALPRHPDPVGPPGHAR